MRSPGDARLPAGRPPRYLDADDRSRPRFDVGLLWASHAGTSFSFPDIVATETTYTLIATPLFDQLCSDFQWLLSELGTIFILLGLVRTTRMEKNVGGIDRTGRIVVGLALAIAGIAALTGYWAIGAVIGVIGVVVGAVLLVTGTTQKCPINEAAGIDTTTDDAR
jgi:phosphoribosylcarboxyaminoimidazole (NCAIR) mutase